MQLKLQFSKEIPHILKWQNDKNINWEFLTFSSWLCTCWTIKSKATKFSPPAHKKQAMCKVLIEKSAPVLFYGELQILPLTSGNHDVSNLHSGLNVLLEGWLYKFIVLFDDAADVPSTLWYVPLQPPYEADVWICIYEHLHVQKLADKRRNHSSTCNIFICVQFFAFAAFIWSFYSDFMFLYMYIHITHNDYHY